MARLIADAIRPVYDYPGTFADSLAPHAARFGLPKGDGLASAALVSGHDRGTRDGSVDG